MIPWLWPAVALIYGLMIGSFLNVVIWRLPRGGSIAHPTWSFCPRCEHRLGAFDLAPILSFLALRARCRYCGSPISWRYPGIELLTGVLFTLVAWRFAPLAPEAAIFHCLFVAVLVCVFFIDLEHFVIPDGLSVLGALIGFVHNAVAIALHRDGQWTQIGPVSLPLSVVGFFGYALVIYAVGLAGASWLAVVVNRHKPVLRRPKARRLQASIHRERVWKTARDYVQETALDWAWVTVYYLGRVIPPLRKYAESPEPLEGATADEIETDRHAGAMGGGDGKLAAAIGANLGLGLALESLMFAAFVGALAGLIVMSRRHRTLGQKTAIPFGPAMVIGALLSLFFGDSLWDWYMSFSGFR